MVPREELAHQHAAGADRVLVGGTTVESALTVHSVPSASIAADPQPVQDLLPDAVQRERRCRP